MLTRKLLFDINAIGFGKWAERRLRLLGYQVHFVNSIHWDWYIRLLAKKCGYIIVTFDSDFSNDENAVVLDMRRNYEENYTYLLKELRRKGWGICALSATLSPAR